MKKLLLSFSILLLLTSLPATAQKGYIGINSGLMYLHKSVIGYEANTPSFGIVGGYNFNPNMRLSAYFEGMLGYAQFGALLTGTANFTDWLFLDTSLGLGYEMSDERYGLVIPVQLQIGFWFTNYLGMGMLVRYPISSAVTQVVAGLTLFTRF